MRLNTTSTKVPLWQIDCENFREVGPFILRDAVSEEHLLFVKEFAVRNKLKWRQDGTEVHFFPKPQVLKNRRSQPQAQLSPAA